MTVNGCKLYGQQFMALMKKNITLKYRNWPSTLFEIALPVLVMLVMVAIRGAVSRSEKPVEFHYGDFRSFKFSESALNASVFLSSIGQKIAWVPGNVPLVQDVQAKFMLRYPSFNPSHMITFDSAGAFEDYITGDSYGKPGSPPVYAAVIFNRLGSDTNGNRTWEYTIRMNATGTRNTAVPQAVPDTYTRKNTDDLQLGYIAADWLQYWNRGFFLLQTFVDLYLLQTQAGVTKEVAISVQPFPTVAHIDDDFANYVRDFLGLMFTLVFLWPVTRIIKLLVEEKELRIKEAMKMMGLQESVLFLSWFATYIIIFAIIAALITAVTSRSVYEYSDKGLIFFFFFLFGITVFCFCYLVSTFFSRARIASVMGALVFLGAFFPYYAVAGDSGTAGQKTLGCLSTPLCFGLGAAVITDFESANQGITNTNSATDLKNFSYSRAIGMMIFDIFLYLILALYFERVLPHTYGIRLPWNFCCRPSYWCPDESSKPNVKETDLDEKENPNIEPVSEDIKKRGGIRVRELRKEFEVDGETNVAVNNVSFDMFQNQIFALLGHNGAGKTTTINMLCGMFPPSSGDAFVFGKSIQSQMPQIRKSLGVCPQHNILFDQLTCHEHLELFAKLKGLESDKVAAAIDDLITQVGLTEKRHTKSGLLSGGQKRKLSVAIALIGDSKIVFLDEPTSGMDPYSRRSTWELLRRGKEGRVIILTTHFMDEADQLGDRIAIMSKGQIRCCGNPLFLKSRYGVGYTMTVCQDRESHVPSSAVEGVVKHYIPASDVLSRAAGEVAFRLPFEDSKQFPALFQDMDRNQKQYGIDSYSISVTTLEEVFLRVGREEDQDIKSKIESDQSKKEEKEKKDALRTSTSSKPHKDALEMESKGEHKIDNASLDMDSLQPSHQHLSKQQIFWRHVRALLIKRWHNARRDKRVWTWQILYPFLIIIVGVGLVKLGNTFDFPSVGLSTCQYNSPNRIPWNDRGSDALNNNLTINSLSAFVYCGNSLGVKVPNLSTRENMSEYLLSTYFANKQSRYGAYMFYEENSTFVNFTIFINTTAPHALPVFWNQYVNTLYRKARDEDSSSVRANLDPMPLTADQKSLRSSTVAVLIAIGFAFIPASFASWIVRERIVKAKHQQFISGVDTLAYWVSMYIWDVINFLIPGFLCILVLVIYDIKQLLGAAIGVTILAIILYGLSITSLTYTISFIFENHVSSQNVMLIFYIFSGAILLVVSIVLNIIDSTRDANRVLRFFYRLLPNYCFGEVMAYTIVRDTNVAFGGTTSPWDMDVSGYALMYMAIETVIYFALVLVIEYILVTPELLHRFRPVPTVEVKPFDDDPDIVQERERITSGKGNGDMIRVVGIQKIYAGRLGAPPKHAVKGLHFGIPEGECFGFLGINGAGKTTTLQILTGDEIPTTGTAFLNQMNIMTEQRLVRHLIGYCPQFDALFDTLTAREHLWFYARIKGVPETQIGRFADALIEKLGLSEYADRPSKGYSGGNKRKLSVGISLIGNPKIVFLDEPSTGMDPKSRRFMWDLIAATMQGRSVVLTTHSMEECEALCSRIGIMVSGRLQCLGSAAHLKARYGYGYQLDINTGANPVEGVTQFIKQMFPTTRMIERHDNNVKYRIEKGIHSLGELFEIIEKNRQQLGITEYSISETTLEQIFIQFAKKQEEETGQVEGITNMEESPLIDGRTSNA